MKVQASLCGMRVSLHELSLEEIDPIWSEPPKLVVIGAVYQIVGADIEEPEVKAV